jgi:hypothetical protein
MQTAVGGWGRFRRCRLLQNALIHEEARAIRVVQASVTVKLATVEELLMWCRAHGAEVVDVIVQDEYTHDLVVQQRSGTYLCFDTT